MMLLQRHIHAALAPAATAGGDLQGLHAVGSSGAPTNGGGGAEGGEGPQIDSSRQLSRLLMADWVTLSVQDRLLLQEMMPLAARWADCVEGLRWWSCSPPVGVCAPD
jgi:hypothetical protein